MYEFKLPDVGEGIHEAEVLQWLVKVGDSVAMDQPIVEIQTDKAIVEIPAPVAGTISEIRVEAGTMTQVGAVLVVITPAGQAVARPVTPTNDQQPVVSAVKAPGIAGPGRRVLAAPAVRKLARELDVDLTQVSGSGPAGRVLSEDVRRFVEEKPAPEPPAPPEAKPEPVVESPPTRPSLTVPPKAPAPLPIPQPGQEVIEEEPLQGLRRRIAERMELAWQVPHVTSFDEIDATHLVALRQQLQPEAERQGVRLTYLPFIIKATVQALKEFPYFNATLDMDRQKILLRRYYHLGIATAIPEGLLVPVVRHADQMNLIQIAAELNRLGELAQQRKLSPEELTGSTFTITNFGSFGGHQGTPIINPPEVAILGCGRIKEKPVAVQGQVEARPVLPLVLSYDHRLLDGAASGRFLGRLKALLTKPQLLFLELV